MYGSIEDRQDSRKSQQRLENVRCNDRATFRAPVSSQVEVSVSSGVTVPIDSPQSLLEWNDQSRFPLDWPLDLNGPVDRPFTVFPDAAKMRPIIELLEDVVRRYPQRIALIDASSAITYAEIWQSIAGSSERIAETTAPGDLIGIVAPASITSPLAMLACLAAGRPFVAIDPNNPSDWIAQVIRSARPSLFLVSNSTLRVVESIVDAPQILNLSSDVPSASDNWRPARMTPDEAACVLFTSGSTGDPKGIVNSQRNLLQRVSQSINAAHINSDDRFLTLASLCTIVGVRDVMTALLAGASLFLLDTHKAGANEILRVIREHRISILFAFPALLRSILQNIETRADERLRLVRIGGDTTLWSDITRLRAWMSPGTHIQLIYAATEAPMMQWFVGENDSLAEERIPIGYPLPGNALTVINEGGTPTPDGDVGELLVRSPYVALGTWSQGCRESEGIQTDSVDPSVRILKTGDLVRRRPDGLYDRIGRKDRQVKIRGARVELDGVEVAIRRHASVRDVGVVIRTDRLGAAKLIAYVQPYENAPDIFLDELRTMMSRVVPPHMLPWRFYTTPRIPRLSNSKLDVKALQAQDLVNSNVEETIANNDPDRSLSTDASIELKSTDENAVQKLVARIWKEVLGVEVVEADADFFDLGGDSLRAIAMIVAIEKALGREVPLNLINQSPGFAEFCAALGQQTPTTYVPLVVIKSGHGSPPLFFVHGAGGSVMELFTLCRNMSWPGPVIGIQARGLERGERPHRTVAAMTNEYITALKAKQPHGPYLLCGYSFGGLVAIELARHLRDAGDDVAFVGLLDTLPPKNHFLRAWTWAAFLCRRPARRDDATNSLKFARRVRNVSSVLRGRIVAANALWASIMYRPDRYAGELTIFEPSTRDLGLPFSGKRWSPYAAKLHEHTLPGRHIDMLMGSNAQVAADFLTRSLELASR